MAQPGWPPAQPRAKLGPGRVILIVAASVLGALVFVAVGLSLVPSRQAEVKVLSCTADDAGFLIPATVELSVKNTSSSMKTFTISIEYRDGSGDRLDVDRATAADVRPGDTVRVRESTMLDSAPSGAVSCLASIVSPD